MATFTTYDQIGKAEDVSDVITNITPTDTPFTSSIRTEKVNARIFEFQEDTLAAAADNKMVEGGALTAGTQTPTRPPTRARTRSLAEFPSRFFPSFTESQVS